MDSLAKLTEALDESRKVLTGLRDTMLAQSSLDSDDLYVLAVLSFELRDLWKSVEYLDQVIERGNSPETVAASHSMKSMITAVYKDVLAFKPTGQPGEYMKDGRDDPS